MTLFSRFRGCLVVTIALLKITAHHGRHPERPVIERTRRQPDMPSSLGPSYSSYEGQITFKAHLLKVVSNLVFEIGECHLHHCMLGSYELVRSLSSQDHTADAASPTIIVPQLILRLFVHESFGGKFEPPYVSSHEHNVGLQNKSGSWRSQNWKEITSEATCQPFSPNTFNRTLP